MDRLCNAINFENYLTAKSRCTYSVMVNNKKNVQGLFCERGDRRPLFLFGFVPQSSQPQPSSVRPISMHDYVLVSIMKPEVRVYIRKPARTKIASVLCS